MDYATPRRVVVDAASTEPVAVYGYSCKLMGLFCASVGLTGLPVDPPPTTPPPVVVDPVAPSITSVTPDTGPDGTSVVIAGTGFGVQGPGSAVTIGATLNNAQATIVSWADDQIEVSVVQDTLPADMPLPVFVTNDAGLVSEGEPAPSFTFAAAARAGKRGAKRTRHSRTGTPEVEELTMPDFPSGAGLMLTSADGTKIVVGPFEMEAGRLYTLPVQFSHGIAVVASGPVDVTFLFAE